MALKNIKWAGSSSESPNNQGLGEPNNRNKSKWRTVVGLIIVYVATILNWQWIWGVFSLYWIIPDFFTGVTYFTEPISRKHNPVLYWLILVTWIAFSIVMFFPTIAAS